MATFVKLLSSNFVCKPYLGANLNFEVESPTPYSPRGRGRFPGGGELGGFDSQDLNSNKNRVYTQSLSLTALKM